MYLQLMLWRCSRRCKVPTSFCRQRVGVKSGFDALPSRTPSKNSCSINSESHRSEEHTSELQSRVDLVCRLLLEKKKKRRRGNADDRRRRRLCRDDAVDTY